MATPRTSYNPQFTADLVARGAFTDEPFSLIDVGASGGIESHWQVFGDSLIAVGFEPLIAEVERLNATSPPNVRYEEAFVTARDRQTVHAEAMYTQRKKYRDTQPFWRTSAYRLQARGRHSPKKVYDPSGSGAVTRKTITLDEFYEQRGGPNVDFLKIDTDDHDYYVLRGAERMLAEAFVLGIFVESQFHGPVHRHANVFSNIDRFLRGRGFSLFDLEVHRYSRAALPQPFVYALPGQTTRGQVLWGDALYARDGGDPTYEEKWQVVLTPMKLIKLACIFEIFGMADCAAELLLNYRGRLRTFLDVRRCLNLLTPLSEGSRRGFHEYNKRFRQKTAEWFPKQSAPAE